MTRQITVLLVDDHALIREGVRAFLETQPDIAVVAEAENGKDAVRLAKEHAPDVALVANLLIKYPAYSGSVTGR